MQLQLKYVPYNMLRVCCGALWLRINVKKTNSQQLLSIVVRDKKVGRKDKFENNLGVESEFSHFSGGTFYRNSK